MNMNQIINMVIRLIMRKTINAGINKGMSMASKGRKSPQRALTPEEEAEFQEFKRQKQLARKQERRAQRNSNSVDRM